MNTTVALKGNIQEFIMALISDNKPIKDKLEKMSHTTLCSLAMCMGSTYSVHHKIPQKHF